MTEQAGYYGRGANGIAGDTKTRSFPRLRSRKWPFALANAWALMAGGLSDPTLEEIELRDRGSHPASCRLFVIQTNGIAPFLRQELQDLTRIFGDFTNPPDVIAYPRNEAEVAAVLDWCGDNGYAAIPWRRIKCHGRHCPGVATVR